MRPLLRYALFALVTVGTPMAPRSALAQGDEAAAEQALQLFDQSKVAYQNGKFDEAIDLLKAAYRLSPEPVLLYNLARAYEGKGMLREAADEYARYLETPGEIPDRGAIEAKVKTLRELADKQEQPTEPPPDPVPPPPEPVPPPPPPEDEGESINPVPWVIAGVGAVGVGVFGVLGGVALGKNSDAEVAPSQQEVADTRASAEDLALGATIALIVGGVALGAGVGWGIFDLTTADEPGEVSLRLDVGPGALRATGRF